MFFLEIDNYLKVNSNYDISYREFTLNKQKCRIYYTSCLVDSNQIIDIISNIVFYEKNEFNIKDIIEIIVHQEAKTIKRDINTIANEVLSGQIIIIKENEEPISIDVKKYPSRSPSESDTEKVIRGSHDGFVESLNTNVALIRRRVIDNNLVTKMYKIGRKSETRVCLMYINGLADENVLSKLDNKLNNINVEQLTMGDKELEELLLEQKFNPYPLVRYTERPDIVAVHLFQGMFALLVDNSSSVILAPATLLDHMQHTEEYRQAPVLGTYLRLIRFLGVFISIFLTPIWLLLYKNNLLNGILSFLIPQKASLSIYIQIIIAEIGVEFLRMASIHTPSALSTAMGLVAGLIIGDIAVSVGLFSEVCVLIVAISAIGTYVTPSYELGLANKLMKLFFILLIIVLNYFGFSIGIFILLIILLKSKSFGKPYLYPIIPFDIKKIMKVIIRFPYKNKKEE